MNPVTTTAKPAADPLLEKIKELVAELHENERGLYVQLVELGRRDPLAGTPEEFFARLLLGGLRKERASEIRTILGNEEVAEEFIAEPKPGEKKLGVKAALSKARAGNGSTAQRGQAAKQSQGFPLEISQALDRLVWLMEHEKRYALEGELFQFRYYPIRRTGGTGDNVPLS